MIDDPVVYHKTATTIDGCNTVAIDRFTNGRGCAIPSIQFSQWLTGRAQVAVPVSVSTSLLVIEQVAPRRGGTTKRERILEDGLLRIVEEQ